MPARVLVIGILFVLFGLHALWDIFSGFFENRLSLNIGVFMLPVGIGLLRGKESSRRWARRWIFLGYALCALMVLLALVAPHGAKVDLLGIRAKGAQAVPYILFGNLVLAICLHVMRRMVDSAKTREWCRVGGR